MPRLPISYYRLDPTNLYVANKVITYDGVSYFPGDPVPQSVMQGRRGRQLLEWKKVRPASPDEIAAFLAAHPPEPDQGDDTGDAEPQGGETGEAGAEVAAGVGEAAGEPPVAPVPQPEPVPVHPPLKQGDLLRMNKANLESLARQRGVSPEGTRAELIARLTGTGE